MACINHADLLSDKPRINDVLNVQRVGRTFDALWANVNFGTLEMGQLIIIKMLISFNNSLELLSHQPAYAS